jgi:ABC-2 type transport system permease protein
LGRPAKIKTMPWVLVGLITVPALVFVIILTLTGEALGLSYTQYPISMWLLIAMFVAGRAPYAISRDLRDGVMPLYLSRPMLRRDYVFAKLAGVSLGTFMFIAIPEVVYLIGSLLAKLPVMTEIGGFLGGLVVAALLSLLLSAIGLVFAAFTPRRGIGVAAIMTTLIMASAIAGIVTQVMLEVGNTSSAAYFEAFDPFALVNGLAVSWLGVEPLDGYRTPAGFGGGLAFTAIYLVVVAGCYGLLVRRYKKVGGV